MRFDLVADLQHEDDAVVGMGHARRSLALAEALQREGVALRLFFPDPPLAERMFPRLGAFGSWEDLWNEKRRKQREMLVVDSYRLAALPRETALHYQQIACFHDDTPPPRFATLSVCCDLSTKNYDRNFSCDSPCDSPCDSLGGGRYFPFHDRFTSNKASGSKRKGRLLLWLGGRETGENLVRVLAKEVLGLWRAEVVISPIVKPHAKLLELAHRREKSVLVHNNAAAMDALLPQCEVYCGGAGVTACEAALLGLKLILCPVAENQRGNARAFERAGATVLPPPFTPDRVRDALRAVEQQAPLDLDSLGLDGRGAERLARALCARVAS